MPSPRIVEIEKAHVPKHFSGDQGYAKPVHISIERTRHYTESWKQTEGELDPVKRAALFIRMNDLLISDVVVIPVIWRNGVAAVSHKLQGLELTSWDSNLWHLAYWYREA